MATGFDTSTGLELELERLRKPLTGYCYRMLGSGSEAEDAVQETFLRAWRKQDSFEGRSSLKSWLYRIATNVCLDMLDGAQRRARPMDLASPTTADTALGPMLAERTWVMPIIDARVMPEDGDPAELAAARETIKLAFVAALQHLPPKQRAVLILREVLRWQASEVAELLGTTTVSVNSALQRARATLDELDLEPTGSPEVDDDEQQELLARYVDAFDRYDVAELVSLLHDDATFQMPPFTLWIKGPDQVAKWMLGPGIECKDAKVLTTRVNGAPAVGIYKPTGPNGEFEPFNLAVLTISGGEITAIDNFLFPHWFTQAGLPAALEAETA
jgi:RNA polymerase sigma-70 factor (ECF subfamily)